MSGEDGLEKRIAGGDGITAGGNVTFGDISGPLAIGNNIKIIKDIEVIFNIHPPAKGGAPITASLKSRLNNLLDSHTLFGGREAELKRLNDFLTLHTSGYLFVTSPSGFGKTALLANWVKSLKQIGQRTCYHFISRFEGVADEDFAMRNLCQQLSSYYGLSGTLPTSTVELRSLYPKLLGFQPTEGEKLVVILDGLDEVMGWRLGNDIFPHDLPQGIFVIFSAREIAEQDWLTYLKLPQSEVEVLKLEKLGIAEIARLLQAAGGEAEKWTEDNAFLIAMHGKSNGDPFYLHYLVKDIRDKQIASLEELEKQPNGLKAYLNIWWEEVSKAAGEQAVSDLMGYLLVSKGRLTRDDLIKISDEDKLTGWVIEGTIKQMQRYVMGNEKIGYTFCHPRFQDYVAQERIKEHEQQPYRKRLLDYCTHWQEHKSNYALSNYANHLVESGNKNEIYKLICKSFMQEKLLRFGSQSFAADVNLAIELARSENNLVQEVRGALIYAALRSVSTSVPPVVLDVLAFLGQDLRALSFASLIVNEDIQILAYRLIGEALLERNDNDEAKNAFSKALTATEKIENKYHKTEKQIEILKVMAQPADKVIAIEIVNRVLEVAEEIKYDYPDNMEMLLEVAGIMAQLGEKVKAVEIVNRVLEVAEKDKNSYHLQWLLEVAKIMAQLRETTRAIEIAYRAVEIVDIGRNDYLKAEGLSELAKIMAQLGEKTKAIEIANQALEVLERIESKQSEIEAIEKEAWEIFEMGWSAGG